MIRCVQFLCLLLCPACFFGSALAEESPEVRPLVITDAELAANFKSEYTKGQTLNVATGGVSVLPPMNFSDFSSLTNIPVVRLYAPDCGLETIEGIGALKKLQVLDLSGNDIHDLSPLKNLPLISVNIAGNPVSDISPILSPYLKELYLSGTEVQDLACLTNTSLERLELGTGPVMSSFSALTKVPLKRLSFLQCPQMQMRDISSLQLESLRVFFLRQDDLRYLTNMPLKELDLQEAEIDSLQPLGPMALRSLTVVSSSLRLLHGIETIPLETLKLFTPHVWDVWPIRNMALKELYMFCDDGDLTSITNIPLHTLGIDKDLAIKNMSLLTKIKTLDFIVWGSEGEGCTAHDFYEEYGRAKQEAHQDLGTKKVRTGREMSKDR